MAHRRKMDLKNGYVVLSIPDSGLFVKNGRIVTGHGTEMVDGEMILFSRRADADAHRQNKEQRWQDGDARGHDWNFPVVPVLVKERL